MPDPTTDPRTTPSFPGAQPGQPVALPTRPRALPGEKKPAAGDDLAGKMPPARRILRFSCPACFTYLEVDPAAPYHGQPAPCPQCATLILPPMIFAAAGPVPLSAPIRVKPSRENMAVEFKKRRRK